MDVGPIAPGGGSLGCSRRDILRLPLGHKPVDHPMLPANEASGQCDSVGAQIQQTQPITADGNVYLKPGEKSRAAVSGKARVWRAW